MADVFADGSVVAWILGFMCVEACMLALFRAKTGLALVDLTAALGAGAALLLALRSALRGSPWPATALWLVVALGAHLVDINRRVVSKRARG